MHWVMWIAEAWLLLGIVTVVVGLFWTNKAADDARRAAAMGASSPSGRRTDFGTTGLSRVRSA